MARDHIEFDASAFAVGSPFGCVVDRDGRVEIVGNALRRLLHIEPGQQIQTLFKVVRPWNIASFLDVKIDPGHTVVLRALHGDLDLKGCRFAVDGGERTAFVGSPVVRDIEEFQRRGLQLSDFSASDATPDLLLSMQATRSALNDASKLSNELKTALAHARAASEAKARFLAMMSHEIRTPLNGFGSMIDLLRDSPLASEQRENLDTMDLCARSLLVLLNDILEFSKLEAGKVEIARRPADVAAALPRIVDHFRAAARERGVELTLRIECPHVRWVSVDIDRIRQVMANLIGNALKFTEHGAVMVRVSDGAPGMLTVDVQDTGIGIPPASVGALFEPFMQADSSSTRRFGGTGLGLTISRQLAQAMGGDVVLVHTDENGSWFRFTFAAPGCTAPSTELVAQAAPDERRFAAMSVLVADDDATNQMIARKLLQKLGITPTVVGDGAEAVEAAQRGRFDLILMDMMMPRLGGVEAAERIRAGGGPCSTVPIIAFSAAAFEADREAATKAGMNGFIEKPARLDSLRQTLLAHLPSTPGGGTGAKPNPNRPTPPCYEPADGDCC